MALEAPMRSSTGSMTFSPQADITITSPDSAVSGGKFHSMSSTSVTSGESPVQRPASQLRTFPANMMSPSGNSDIVGPSPVTSIGTEITEIEDDEQDESRESRGVPNVPTQLKMLKTNVPNHVRQLSSEEAVSVIHAPETFHQWVSHTPEPATLDNVRDLGVISPPPSEGTEQMSFQNNDAQAPPPISTDVAPVRYGADIPTPQAQNLNEILQNDASRMRPSSVAMLKNIPESHEADASYEAHDDYVTSPHMEGDGEIEALKMALEECWTLCNTLANLSSIHRERMFNSSGTPDAHEKAWKCCWKLCQRLYYSRDVAHDSFNVLNNLELCRNFCQALFDVRTRKDDTADSVLRVSFELNNHLYSAQDSRSLPEPFKERTLDFYITLCHRLMKQRNELMEETDNLLRACWALAEMLFSLRQNSRDGRAPDTELIGSAVQACWELCDMFREGWTQVRPDRGTPRPSQVTFQHGHSHHNSMASETGSVHSGTTRVSSLSKRDSFGMASMASMASLSNMSSLSERDRERERPGSVASMSSLRKARGALPPPVPETPVTEFEDTPISPESSSPQMPNIMVLGTSENSSVSGGSSRVSGPNTGTSNTGRWPSGSSNLSGYSQGSNKTSSTATTATAEDVNILRIKVLVLKAAMNLGFNRDAAAGDGTGGVKTLQQFVKSMPTGSFGSLPQHASILKSYKMVVAADQSFRTHHCLPPRGRRVSAVDMAKSVGWMTLRSNQYNFLRDLYRLVFSFAPEEADNRKTVAIAV